MLLVLLLAGLAGLAGARRCDPRVLRHKLVSEGVQEFVAYLKTCELGAERHWIFDIICEQNSCEALLAVLEKAGDPSALKGAIKAVTLRNKVDLLAALVEKGYGVFVNCHYMQGGNLACDRMRLTKFYCDLGTDYCFSGCHWFHDTSLPASGAFNTSEIEILYFLIGQGFDMTSRLLPIFPFFGESAGDFSLLQWNCQFLLYFMERMNEESSLPIILGCALRFENGLVIERLLEMPEVLCYLRLAKHAAGVLLHTNGQLAHYFEQETSQEGDLSQRPRKIQFEKRVQLAAEFKRLTEGAEQEGTLLEPLTVQDLQLVVTPQSDVCKRVYVFLLGLAYNLEYMY